MEDYLKFAIKTAKESGKLLLKMQNRAKIENEKGDGDFAMDADIKSEQHIIKAIQKKYPKHDILTEETGHYDKNSEYLWVIDPLEGTLNYANKLPIWAVNIGLFYRGEPYMGVIYAPILKELFYAQKGKGAFCNGKRIHVNENTDLEKTLYALSSIHVKNVTINPRLIRSLGCAGMDLVYIANGKFSARIKPKGPDPYGYGAGSIIVTEAGGKITDTKGNKWTLTSNGAIATNGKIHEKILKALKENNS